MKKKKILFIAYWYPSADRPSSGIFVRNHAQCIAEIADLTVLSIEIIYAKTLFRKSVSVQQDGEIKSCKIQVKSRFNKILYYALPLHKYWLKKAFKQHQISVNEFDLIHSNVLFPSGLIGLDLAKKHNKPLVHTEHWSKLHKFLTKDVYRKKGQEVLNYASKITAVSHFLGDQLSNYVKSEKITLIPNVIDDTRFCYAEKKKEQQSLKFLCVATWNKPKNPFYFLNALEILYKQKLLPHFELDFVGDGVLLNQVHQNNYSFPIHFKGFVPSKELPSLFQQADFFLHSSDYETFSIVLVEALSTGTPVLISRVGLAEELIHQENGFICENSVDDWVDKIAKATNKQYDHRKIAAEVEGRYNKEKISELFLEVYEGLGS